MGVFKEEVWKAEYNGHNIEVTNKVMATLYIDGKEADKEKGINITNAVLMGKIPVTDETVLAYLYMTDVTKVNCRIFIGNEIELQK